MKFYNRYETENIEAKDPALSPYINFEGKLKVKSHGRHREKFRKANINIMEKLANQLSVPGHRRKKHRIITSWATGKFEKNMKNVLKAFEIIEKKTGKNPVQVFVDAVENSAPRDEITVIEYGGARYPQAVDSSPSRRLSLAIRHLVHGAYDNSFNKKTKIHQALADEILKASQNNNDSYAIKRKNEFEKQADSAR